MTDKVLKRRTFLTGSAALPTVFLYPELAAAKDDGAYAYPVTRSAEHWRTRLSPIEHYVMREGGTEAPRSSPLWNSKGVGTYCCRGCDLTLYHSMQKIELDKGWVFFRHARKDSVMTDLDLGDSMAGDPFAELSAAMEVHCRRCGSHLGHIVALPEVPERPIHCINGFALRFQAAAA